MRKTRPLAESDADRDIFLFFCPLFSLQIGEKCRETKSVVSILGIEGEDCNMSQVAKCAELSGGDVNKLNPLELTRQLRLISQNRTVATDVELSVLLHPSLQLEKTVSSQVRTAAMLLNTRTRQGFYCLVYGNSDPGTLC